MPQPEFLYFFNYDDNESVLCKLESRFIFRDEEKNKLLLTDINIDPSISAFIKKRLDVLASSAEYPELIRLIADQKIQAENFKVEYLVLEGDASEYADRLSKLRDIGFCIEGEPDYHQPAKVFGICLYDGKWYFGELIKNSFDWHKHSQKPCSYSNSISSSVAKAVINIASDGNRQTSLLDACCGVGTILLEACFAGYSIEGCDINEKICEDGRQNLAHFGYKAIIHHSDIQDLKKPYDAAIVDLPYNLFSHADEASLLGIITSAAAISGRQVIISSTDIRELIEAAGLELIDYCSFIKRRKANFTRRIWVCRKAGPSSSAFGARNGFA